MSNGEERPSSSQVSQSFEDMWAAREEENRQLMNHVLEQLSRIEASTQGSTPATTPQQSLEYQARMRAARQKGVEGEPLVGTGARVDEVPRGMDGEQRPAHHGPLDLGMKCRRI